MRRTIQGPSRKSGFNSSWLHEFKWLECVEEFEDGKTGLNCKVCSLYGKTPRNGMGSWCTTPCFALRRDRIARHEASSIHKAAIAAEADATAGGIEKSFSDQISLEMKAAIGCLKCIYWLCKNEIAPPPFQNLATTLMNIVLIQLVLNYHL